MKDEYARTNTRENFCTTASYVIKSSTSRENLTSTSEFILERNLTAVLSVLIDAQGILLKTAQLSSLYSYPHITEMNAHYTREGGDNRLFLTLVFKDYLFAGLTTLRTLSNFDWLVHLVECPNVLTTNCILKKENFVYHH